MPLDLKKKFQSFTLLYTVKQRQNYEITHTAHIWNYVEMCKQ